MKVKNMVLEPEQLTPFKKESAENIYIIMDCAHFDHKVYREIRKDRTLITKSLFTDTPDENSAFAGPVLIGLNLEKNVSFIQKIKLLEQEKPAVLWLKTEQKFDPLFSFLQSILYGELENGEKVLCRYYDPRCIKAMLNLFSSDTEVSQKIWAIKAWAFKAGNNHEYSFLP